MSESYYDELVAKMDTGFARVSGFPSKQEQLEARSEEKKRALTARSIRKQAEMPWEDVPASSTGIRFWKDPGLYNNDPRAADDELQGIINKAVWKGQEGAEDPRIQVQRPFEGAPDQNNLDPYVGFKNPETGELLSNLIPHRTRQGSFEQDEFIRGEKLREIKAGIAGEEFVPEEYDIASEKEYDKYAYLSNPGDKHYAKSRADFHRQIYPDGMETLYTGEDSKRFPGPGEGDNIQMEHIYPMNWVRNQMNAKDNTALDREGFQKTSAEFNEIEADMHNLWPARAGNNKLRNTKAYANILGENYLDVAGKMQTDERRQLFSPDPESRGQIARSSLYMSGKYGLEMPAEQRVQMEEWAEAYPATQDEKIRNVMIGKVQGNMNPFIPAMDQEELIASLEDPDNKMAPAAVHLFSKPLADPGPRSTGDILGDTAGSIAKGAIAIPETVYGLANLASMANPGNAVKAVSELAQGKELTAPATLDSGLNIGHYFGDWRKWVDDNIMSETQQYERAKFQQAEGLKEKESSKHIAALKESGEYDLIEDGLMTWLGDVGGTFENLWDQPLVALDEATQFIPQALSGGALAKVTLGAFKKQLAKGHSAEAMTKFWASDAGKKATVNFNSRVGMGNLVAQESMTNAVGAQAQVMLKTHEQLMKTSQDYRDMMDNNVDKDEAKRQLADKTFMSVAAITAMTAFGSAKMTGTGKLEGNLLNPAGIAGKSAIATAAPRTLLAGAREGIEEGIQGGTGEAAQNLAKQLFTDNDVALSKGTASATAMGMTAGALGGAGLTGGLALPLAAIGDTVNAAKTGVQTVQNKHSDKIISKLPEATAPDADHSKAINAYTHAISRETDPDIRKTHIADMNSRFATMVQDMYAAERDFGKDSNEHKAALNAVRASHSKVANIQNDRKTKDMPAFKASAEALAAGTSTSNTDVNKVIDNISMYESTTQTPEDFAIVQSLLSGSNTPDSVKNIAKAAESHRDSRIVLSTTNEADRTATAEYGPTAPFVYSTNMHNGISSSNHDAVKDNYKSLQSILDHSRDAGNTNEVKYIEDTLNLARLSAQEKLNLSLPEVTADQPTSSGQEAPVTAPTAAAGTATTADGKRVQRLQNAIAKTKDLLAGDTLSADDRIKHERAVKNWSGELAKIGKKGPKKPGYVKGGYAAEQHNKFIDDYDSWDLADTDKHLGAKERKLAKQANKSSPLSKYLTKEILILTKQKAALEPAQVPQSGGVAAETEVPLADQQINVDAKEATVEKEKKKRKPYKRPKAIRDIEDLPKATRDAMHEYVLEIKALLPRLGTVNNLSEESDEIAFKIGLIEDAIASLRVSNMTPEQLSNTEMEASIKKKYGKNVNQRTAIAKVRELYKKVNPKFIHKDYQRLANDLVERKLSKRQGDSYYTIQATALQLFEFATHLNSLIKNENLEAGNLVYVRAKKGNPHALFQILDIDKNGYVKLLDTKTYTPRRGRRSHISAMIPWSHKNDISSKYIERPIMEEVVVLQDDYKKILRKSFAKNNSRILPTTRLKLSKILNKKAPLTQTELDFLKEKTKSLLELAQDDIKRILKSGEHKPNLLMAISGAETKEGIPAALEKLSYRELTDAIMDVIFTNEIDAPTPIRRDFWKVKNKKQLFDFAKKYTTGALDNLLLDRFEPLVINSLIVGSKLFPATKGMTEGWNATSPKTVGWTGQVNIGGKNPIGPRALFSIHTEAYADKSEHTAEEFMKTVRHELGHNATVNTIHRVNVLGKGSAFEKAAVKQMEDVFEFVKNSPEGQRELAKGRKYMLYGLTNVKEFVAEGFSDIEFQEWLRTINVPPSAQIPQATGKNAWGSFIQSVGRILGLLGPTAEQTYMDFNALSEFVKASDPLLRATESINEPRQRKTKVITDIQEQLNDVQFQLEMLELDPEAFMGATEKLLEEQADLQDLLKEKTKHSGDTTIDIDPRTYIKSENVPPEIKDMGKETTGITTKSFGDYAKLIKQFGQRTWSWDAVWFGPTSYSYSGITHKQQNMPPTVKKLAGDVAKQLDLPADYFNSALINLFPAGHKGINAHADDEAELRLPDGSIGAIGVITLGGSNTVTITDNETGLASKIETSDGHLYAMPPGEFQDGFKHTVGPANSERISITLRRVNTPESEIENIWWGDDKHPLSNLAPREFTFNDRKYYSVEHAYQSLKSGTFDEDTFNKYTPAAGTKIIGSKGTNKKTNIKLMEDLLRTSFTENAAAKKALLATGDKVLKHTQDTGIWKDTFPALLEKIRTELQPIKNHAVIRVISGGQTGGDIAGLRAAKKAGIATGGTATKGYRTDNPNKAEARKEMEEFGLLESSSAQFPARTMQNVDDADGTIAFISSNTRSVGTSKTIGYAKTGQWAYPADMSSTASVLVIDPSMDRKTAVQNIRTWLIKNGIKTVNIAGHRESSLPGLENYVQDVLGKAFSNQAPVVEKPLADKEKKANEEAQAKQDALDKGTVEELSNTVYIRDMQANQDMADPETGEISDKAKKPIKPRNLIRGLRIEIASLQNTLDTGSADFARANQFALDLNAAEDALGELPKPNQRTDAQKVQADIIVQGVRGPIETFLHPYRTYGTRTTNLLDAVLEKHRVLPFYKKMQQLAEHPYTKPAAWLARERLIKKIMNQYEQYGTTEEGKQKFYNNTFNGIYTIYSKYGTPNTITTVVNKSNRGMQNFLGTGKGTTSVFSNTPDFFKTWMSPVARKKLVERFTLDSDETTFLDSLVDFSTEFKAAMGATRKAFYTDKEGNKVAFNTPFTLQEDPIRRFMDENHMLQEDFVDALSVATYQYMGSQGTSVLGMGKIAINTLLGLSKKARAPEKALTLLKDAGSPLRDFAENIGRMTLQQLNLKAFNTVDGNFQTSLEYSIGMQAISALRNESFSVEGRKKKYALLTVRSVLKNDLSQYAEEENELSLHSVVEEDASAGMATLRFVRLAQIHIDSADKTTSPAGLNESIIENTRKFREMFKKVFYLTQYTSEPTGKAKKTGPDKIKHQNNLPSPHLKDGFQKLQEVSWGAKEKSINLMLSMGTSFLNIGGYVEDVDNETHVTQRERQTIINDSLTRDLTAIKTFLEENSDEMIREHYFSYAMLSNMRSQMESTSLNPAGKKMHRFTFRPNTWVTTIKTYDPKSMSGFKAAVMAGMGDETTKNTHNQLVEAFNKQFLTTNKRIPDKYVKAVRAVQRGSVEGVTLSPTDQQHILDFISNFGGEKYHSFDALQALTAYYTAIQNGEEEFTMDIGREVDGTTNGVAASFMQIVGNDWLDIGKPILQAAGMRFAGDKKQSFAEYISNLHNDDNYQSISRKTGDYMDKLKTHFTSIAESPNNNWEVQKEALDSLRRMDALHIVMGDILVEKLNEAAEPYMVVTSAGRQLSKDPLMVTAYGASIQSVLKNLEQNVMDNYYVELMNREDTQEKEIDRLTDLIFAGDVLSAHPNKGFDSTRKEAKTAAREKVIAEKLYLQKNIKEYTLLYKGLEGTQYSAEKYFKENLNKFYGAALEETLIEHLGDFNKNRALILGAFREMSEIFVAMFNSRVEERTQLKKQQMLEAGLDISGGTSLSKDELKGIEQELREEGFVPGIRHASSVDTETHSDSVEIIKKKYEMATVPHPKTGKLKKLTLIQQHKKPMTVTKLSLDSGNKLKESDVKEKTIGSTMQRSVFVSDPGAKAFTLTNLTADGNTQAFLMKQYEDMMNLFDATMNSTKNIDEAAGTENIEWGNLQKQWSMVAEVDRKLKHFRKGIAANSGDSEAHAAYKQKIHTAVNNAIRNKPISFTKGRKNLITTLRGQYPKPVKFDSVHKLHWEFDKFVKDVAKNRKDMFALMESIEQYANEGSEAREDELRPSARAYAKAFDALVAETEAMAEHDAAYEKAGDYGSQPGAFTGFTPYTTKPEEELTSDAATRIFRELDGLGNVNENATHKNYLHGLIQNVISPALAGVVDPIMIQLGAIPERNTGRMRGKKVYVGLSDAAIVKSGSDMSAHEVYAHELVHAVWKDGLNTNHDLINETRRLFNIAKRNTTAVDLLRKNENGNVIVAPNSTLQLEMDQAQELWNHIFINQDGYLHEFATFGTTNEAFMNALNGLENKLPKTMDKGIVAKLLDIFNRLIDFLQYGHKSKNVGAALQKLAHDTIGINNETQSRIDKKFIEGHAFINSKAVNMLTNFMTTWYVPKVHSRFVKRRPDDNILLKALDTTFSAPYLLMNGYYQQSVNNMMYGAGKNMDNVVYKLLDEITGPTVKTQQFHNLLRMSKHAVQAARQNHADGVSKQIPDRFLNRDDIPDEEEFEIMEKVLLKSDMVALMGRYTVGEIIDIINDNRETKKEIGKLRDMLYTNFSDGLANYYDVHAESLANIMVNNRAGAEQGHMNAHTIANMKGYSKARTATAGVDVARAENIIEILTSLYAIDKTRHDQRSKVASRMRDEYGRHATDNGITYILAMAQDIKDRSMRENFNGNPTLMLKGYTVELFDENKDTRVGTLAQEQSFNEMNFYRVGEVQTDPNMGQSVQRYLYVSKTRQLNKRISGITSNKDKQGRGFDVLDVHKQSHPPTTNEQLMAVRKAANRTISILQAKTDRAVEAQMAGTKKNDFSKNWMVPTRNEYGKIVTFRYLMTEQTKHKHLGKQNVLPKVMGQMSAGIEDKVVSDRYNRKFFQMAKDFYDKEFGNETRGWVTISQDSPDGEKYQELYALLPTDAKRAIKDIWGDEDMVIRSDMVDLAFGFRKMSLSDFFGFLNNKTLNQYTLNSGTYLKQGLRLAELLWQSVITKAKRGIVVLMPQVLHDNIMSNFWLLVVTKGIPPVYAFKHMMKAVKYSTQYQSDLAKLADLERLVKLDPNSAKIEDRNFRISVLQKRLKSNPVVKLQMNGVMGTIVEDLDPEQYKDPFFKTLGSLFPEAFERVKGVETATPEWVKESYQQLVMAPNTGFSKVLTTSVQLSDFVARYAMFKYDTEHNNVDEQQAIENAVETFIAYDVPTSPQMQYINDMGMWMFTKFFFRIMRVVFKHWRDTPGSALMFELAQQFLGDTPNINDYNPINVGISGLLNRWSFPGSPFMIDRAFEPHLLNQTDWADLFMEDIGAGGNAFGN